jgi:hypothetical protein
MPFPSLVQFDNCGPAQAGIDVLDLIQRSPADVLDLLLCRAQDLHSWGAGGASSRAIAIFAAAVVESAGLASQNKIARGWGDAVFAYYAQIQAAGVPVSEAGAVGLGSKDRLLVESAIYYLGKGGRLDSLAGLRSWLSGLASVGWFVVVDGGGVPLGRYADLQKAKAAAKAAGYSEAPARIGPASSGRYAGGYRPWASVVDGWGSMVYEPRFRHDMAVKFLRAGGYPAPSPGSLSDMVADLALSPADLWFLGWPYEAAEAERKIQAALGRPAAKLDPDAFAALSSD